MGKALLVIDVQNDFTEGGALEVVGGAAVAAGLTHYLSEHGDEYEIVLASRDWHEGNSDNGGHFATDTEPDFTGTWPVHCVAGTPGAAYHEDFDTSQIDYHVLKGQGVPAYSIFEGRTDAGLTVHNLLDEHGIDTVDVAGIATDFCVRASALDALEHGQHVRVLTGLVAGVAAGSSEAALAELAYAGAELVPAS